MDVAPEMLLQRMGVLAAEVGALRSADGRYVANTALAAAYVCGDSATYRDRWTSSKRCRTLRNLAVGQACGVVIGGAYMWWWALQNPHEVVEFFAVVPGLLFAVISAFFARAAITDLRFESAMRQHIEPTSKVVEEMLRVLRELVDLYQRHVATREQLDRGRLKIAALFVPDNGIGEDMFTPGGGFADPGYFRIGGDPTRVGESALRTQLTIEYERVLVVLGRRPEPQLPS